MYEIAEIFDMDHRNDVGPSIEYFLVLFFLSIAFSELRVQYSIDIFSHSILNSTDNDFDTEIGVD